VGTKVGRWEKVHERKKVAPNGGGYQETGRGEKSKEGREGTSGDSGAKASIQFAVTGVKEGISNAP